jgi:hypothetical protein
MDKPIFPTPNLNDPDYRRTFPAEWFDYDRRYAEWLDYQIVSGNMTANELRIELGLEPSDEAWGDTIAGSKEAELCQV